MTSASAGRALVLFLDDDPQHLKLYRWVIERGPFTVIPVLVGAGGCALPKEQPDVVALDYRLKGSLTAVDIAKQINAKYPGTPIVVLSEMEWLPREMVPYSVAFVNKGEPEKLMRILAEVCQRPQDSEQQATRIQL